MRTIRISWSKVIPLIIFLTICWYELRQSRISRYRNHGIAFGDHLVNIERHVNLATVFLGKDKLGNFEYQKDNRMGPGEGGKPHIAKKEQKFEEDRSKSMFGFNQLVSDEISLDRSIPDTRPEECKHWNYPEKLPTASIVLIFHNEGFSTLFRTVHSILNRSPAEFLHEIVLVDDKSELKHLHEKLDEEVKKPYYQNKVKIVRNKDREGLIRSRNNGALASSGDVVVFLDAHCEVGYNWLPPLLAPIAKDTKTMTVPIIDGIDWNDFSINKAYQQGRHHRGIFEWGMLYKEGPLPQKEADKQEYFSEPYNAPTHAGGLFAIHRSWFRELGWYDPGLQVWGGENYELSFKIWQCGGKLLWVPCSHVGHVYRGHSCSTCSSSIVTNKWNGVPLALRNYKRFVETWFDDEFKEYFYTREPIAKFIDMGDISKQIAIKNRLNCKSFGWFMKEIAYDVYNKYPAPPPNAYWGEIRSVITNLCIDTLGRGPPSRIGSSSCHSGGGAQLWRLNTKGQLASGEWCVMYLKARQKEDNELSLMWCDNGIVSGPWVYESKSLLLKHNIKNLCVTLEPKSLKLKLEGCRDKYIFQQWKFQIIKPHWVNNQPHFS